jgi:hypothetical protein
LKERRERRRLKKIIGREREQKLKNNTKNTTTITKTTKLPPHLPISP